MNRTSKLRIATALLAVAVCSSLFSSFLASAASAASSGGTERVIVGVKTANGKRSAANEDERASMKKSQDDVESELKGTNHRVVRKHETLAFMALEVGQDALDRLKKSSKVSSIEPDEENHVDLDKSTQLIRSTTAASFGVTGSGQTIAVLDTGVQTGHVFLSGAVVAEACFTQDASCPNGQTTMTGAGAGRPCSWSRCDHGTHVAGIALGREASYDGKSLRGVARTARLISVRVFSAGGCTSSPCAFTSDIIAGLDHVNSLRTQFKIAAVNMSLGGSTKFTSRSACDQANTARKTAIDALRANNIATVVAAGNDGFTDGLSAPGCISSAISVGATTKTDTVASYSNSASFMDLWAPGHDILSSVPTNAMGRKNGTSMAAPHVAGAWAMLKQRYPNASVASVLSALQRGGVPVTDPRNNVTKMRIDVLSGVQNIRTFSVNDITPWENSGNATFTIRMGAAESFPVAVTWSTQAWNATAGSDFQHASGSVTFNAGETVKTIAVPLVDDAVQESDEQFFVRLAGSAGRDPIASDQFGIATIHDNDNPRDQTRPPPTCCLTRA